MKCTTVLHGDECNRTSTPHKNGNKMKGEKKLLFDRLPPLFRVLPRQTPPGYCG